jgi:hypothetical protein
MMSDEDYWTPTIFSLLDWSDAERGLTITVTGTKFPLRFSFARATGVNEYLRWVDSCPSIGLDKRQKTAMSNNDLAKANLYVAEFLPNRIRDRHCVSSDESLSLKSSISLRLVTQFETLC